MKDVLSVMQNYIKAYKDNDKQCFESLWDSNAIFEDPVAQIP